MPTDFVTAANSQLVYIVGTLGYDFITDARRDYFVQQFADMSTDHLFIDQFGADLGLVSGPTYLPEDNRAMSAYLSQGPPGRPVGRNPQDIGSLMWVLYQENMPLYALRPLHTLALAVLATFANFLYDQSRLPEDAHGNPNPLLADRVSIAGRIIGDITLYNGQQVPVLDVSLRALFEWKLEDIITDALGPVPDAGLTDERARYDQAFEQLKQFLERVYYELRNMGQSPSDRAINYLATNVFQAKEAFTDAVKNNLTLDSIYAEKSPICRPKSDCWDVIMRFFDPLHRMDRAVDEYRLTVDVNDMSPVGIGKLRKWARFA
jgi:cyanobactin maturation PatA/PatG family protease